MDRYPFSLLAKHPFLFSSTVAVVLTLTPLSYAIYLHQGLSLKIQHKSSKTPIFPTGPSSVTKRITSLPSSASATPHIAVHDIAWKTIPFSLSNNSQGENDQERKELLTTYLRHTMGLFASRLPQAYILRVVVSPEARKTFQQEYIKTLNFREGDLVCGVYRVALHTSEKVEFEMVPLPGMGDVVKGGRMVIRIEPQESGEESLVSTETIMWKSEGEKGLMPLETSVGRWMHELASWWLLDRGTKLLMGLKKDEVAIGK